MEVTGPNVVDGCAEGGAGDNGGEQDYCVEGSGGSATDRTAENHTGHIKMKKGRFPRGKRSLIKQYNPLFRYDPAVHHHKSDFPEIVYIRKRVALNHKQIRLLARFNRSNLMCQIADLRTG